MDNKTKIKKEYEAGATLKQLSEKYNLKLNTIKSWSRREGWKKKQKSATKNATFEKKLQPKKSSENKKKEAYKRILNGEIQDKIGHEIGVSRSTVANWSASYKWQVEKELLLNKSLQEIREKVFGDKKAELEELILWIKKELEEIKLLVENATDDEIFFINSKFSMIDKYMKMQFKLLGVKYTGELTELVRVANQIEFDEKRYELEKAKTMEIIEIEELTEEKAKRTLRKIKGVNNEIPE